MYPINVKNFNEKLVYDRILKYQFAFYKRDIKEGKLERSGKKVNSKKLS